MPDLIATGFGRVRLEVKETGHIEVKMRVRRNDHKLGPYHRAALSPESSCTDLESRGFPAELCDEEMYAGTGITLRDVIEGYIEAHRTPERLKRWERQKAARAEAEKLEMDAPRER